MRFEGFIGPTYLGRSARANAERCINLFPEVMGGTPTSPIVYHGTPGLANYITLPGNPVRCLWSKEDKVYFVSGPNYGSISHTIPSYTTLGTVWDDGLPADIYSNGNQLLIRSGPMLYCDNGAGPIDLTTTLGVTSHSATYLDGYFVSLTASSNEIRISALFNGLSWNPLDVQLRMSSHDRLLAIASDGEKLWLFGRRAISVWYNSGNADFPFEPVPGATIDQGIAVADSLVSLDGSFFFIGEDDRGSASVMRTRGYQVERVSTHAIDYYISKLYGYSAWAYEEEGHKFYVLSERVGTHTFVYDATTNLWHERAYWSGTQFVPHKALCHCYAGSPYTSSDGIHLVGARDSGRVYIQSLSNLNDAGDAIRRYRQAPYIGPGNRIFAVTWHDHATPLEISDAFLEVSRGDHALFYHELKIDQKLVGTPNITLKWSDDNGTTWTSDKVPVLTATSDAKKRLIWRRLGSERTLE